LHHTPTYTYVPYSPNLAETVGIEPTTRRFGASVASLGTCAPVTRKWFIPTIY